MKTMASILCLAVVGLTSVYVGERSLFFTDYLKFLAIFAVLALLVTATACWTGVISVADDRAGQDDTYRNRTGNGAHSNTDTDDV